MKLIKAAVIAFSVYSKFPMPQIEWEEEDMKYMLCFFPWIGAAIGICLYLWHIVCSRLGTGAICYTAIGMAIPLLVTGGFHVDGFMDTMDAFHSYQPREKKLEILKDSHVGAFSVIMLAAYGLIYAGAFSQITDTGLFKAVCSVFFLSRCLSGISVVSFPLAKSSGMVHTFANGAHKKIVKAALYAQSAACIGVMLLWSVQNGILLSITALLTWLYYYHRTKKELGGISGDTAGYFVLLCEGSVLVAAALMNTIK